MPTTRQQPRRGAIPAALLAALSLGGLGLGGLGLDGLCFSRPATADEPLQINVILKDHRFAPSEIHVPTGKRAMLILRNEDTTPEEFDSTALAIEKVVVGGTYATIRLHPLGPGRYPFMGEFHPDTAQGVVISE